MMKSMLTMTFYTDEMCRDAITSKHYETNKCLASDSFGSCKFSVPQTAGTVTVRTGGDYPACQGDLQLNYTVGACLKGAMDIGKWDGICQNADSLVAETASFKFEVKQQK